MSLPKIVAPTFDCVLPSTGEKIMFRPFLVKEEKILLMAKESKEHIEIYRALRQIINNCVLNEGFNVDDCTITDMDYLFLKLRAKSVGEIVDFKVTDSTDGLDYSLKVNLDEVEVIDDRIDDEKEMKIMINETIGVKLKYPTPKVSENLAKSKSLTQMNFDMIDECIDFIFDDKDVCPWDQASKKEKNEFIESISSKKYKEIEEFFAMLPRIEHVVEYTNSKDEKKIVVFRSIDDFFTLV